MITYVARQPIFDATLTVQAYELLIREGLEGILPAREMDVESARVLAASQLLPRLDAVAAGKPIFVRVTREILVQGYAEILPPKTTSIQLVDSIKPDRDVIEACNRIKRAGYRIVLDGFRLGSDRQALLPLANMVKVNVTEAGATERAVIAERARPRKITMVADKIQTRDIFSETKAIGYDLFEGVFFAHPSIVVGKDIPTSKRSCLQILGQLHQPDLDVPALSDIISREVGLAYKLLRYVNSAAFGWHGSITSIQHALMLMGSREIRRWASVMALTSITGEEPGELLSEALLRGRTCELLASEADQSHRAADLFLLGLFSLLDAILEIPMAEILENLPLAPDVKAALLGESGPLREVYQLAVDYLAGEWAPVPERAHRLGISESGLPDLYEEALAWCGESRRFAALAAA
jgi:c-di-GMP-related signal transduction protein